MKKCIFGWCLLLSAACVQAQSYHFSQFFSTPLLTNPANTGFTDGSYRVSTNMRRQGVGDGPYFTGYVSAEASVLQDRLPLGHKAGIGFYAMNDNSLLGAVKTNTAGMSLAYHVGLDPYGEQSIGLGMQASVHHRRIDYSRLTFENQFGPGGFDGSLPVGENLYAKNKTFFDLATGLTYNRIVGNNAYFAGVSVYNLLNHKENMLDENFKIPTRFVFQAGSQFGLEYGKLYASLTTMRQSNASETTLGLAYGYYLTEENKDELIGGMWLRYKDALIPYLGFQRANLTVGLSYDLTVSELQTGAQVRNAFELTLIFKSSEQHELKTTIPWY